MFTDFISKTTLGSAAFALTIASSRRRLPTKHHGQTVSETRSMTIFLCFVAIVAMFVFGREKDVTGVSCLDNLSSPFVLFLVTC